MRPQPDPGLHPGLCCVGLSALKPRPGGRKACVTIARGEAPGRVSLGLTVLAAFAAIAPVSSAANTLPPPRPAAKVKPGDGFELVVYGQTRPVRARIAVSYQGRPAGERWAAALKQAFTYYDRDGDGSLSAAEAKFVTGDGGVAAMMTSGSFVPDPTGRPKLDALDADGDGRVSAAEFAAYHRRSAAQAVRAFAPLDESPLNARATDALFELFDRGGDGKLTRAEVATAETLLPTRDEDEDECLSLGELLGLGRGEVLERRTNRRPADPEKSALARTVALYDPAPVPVTVTPEVMKRYDMNGDNRLTPAEVGFDADTFARFDADRDETLSTAEVDGWQAGPPDLEASLSLAPTADACRAELLTDPADLAARGFAVRRVEGRRFVVRHGRQAIEFWAFASVESGQGSLKEQYGETFRDAAGEKGHVVPADLSSPVHQLVRVLFDPADRDADGKLTQGEFDRYLGIHQAFIDLTLGLTPAVQTPTLFQLLDENRDGKLGVRELRTAWDRLIVLQPPGEAGGADEVTRAALQPAVSVRLTRAFDRTAPGQFGAFGGQNTAVPDRGPVWFWKMDRNGDGDLSRGEYLGTREEFNRLDADRDGLVGRAEAEAFDRSARPVPTPEKK